MPLRRHPVPRVQKEILRAATGAQLAKARTLAVREVNDDRLPAPARADAVAWLDVVEREITRRVGDGDPGAISVL